MNKPIAEEAMLFKGASHLRIRELEPEFRPQWETYVENNPEATFFHRAGWKEVFERAFGHRCFFLYAESEGRIRGILPLGQIRSRFFGNALISLPLCAYGGVVAQDAETRSALENAACDLAARIDVDYLEVRNRQPRRLDWASKELYFTFRKKIDPDIEKNLLNIPRKQRAMVRKGIKAGLKSAVDDDVDRFYEFYACSVHNLGTPVFPKNYFRILKQVFKSNCDILTITHDDHPVCGVMSFYHRDEVLPYYAGGTREARNVPGHDFMYWELMRRACEKGLRIFDYGRSKIGTGSYSFKKNWGFTPEPLHYEYLLVKGKEIPNINPLNPKYRLFINLWKRLPLSVTKIIGPLISKNFN